MTWRATLRSAVSRLSAAMPRRSTSIIIALVICVAAVWLATRSGPAHQGYFDSAFYLDGARHLARGDGYVSAATAREAQTFGPITRWAPGFSMITAVPILLGVPALSAAALVVAASYVIAVLAAFLLGIELLTERQSVLSALCAALFATMQCTLLTLNALLSDLTFGAVALLNTLWIVRIARGHATSLFARALLGLGLAAMVLLRYAGALYIPGLFIAAGLVVWLRTHSLRSIASRLLPSGIVSMVAVSLWTLRNRNIGSGAFGERVLADSDLTLHLERAAKGAFAWVMELLQHRDMLEGDGLVTWGLVVAAFGCVALLVSSNKAREPLIFTIVPIATYIGLMSVVASRMLFDAIDHPRFWVPVWALTLLAIASLIASASRMWLRVAAGAVTCVMMGSLALFGQSIYAALPAAAQPRGLLSDAWKRAAAVLPDPRDCRLFVMDARPFMLHRELGPTTEIPQTIEEFEAAAGHHPSLCVAVVSKRLRLSTSAERRRVGQQSVVDMLNSNQRLERIAHADGVTVYRLRRGPG